MYRAGWGTEGLDKRRDANVIYITSSKRTVSIGIASRRLRESIATMR